MNNEGFIRACTGILLILTTAICCSNNILSLSGIAYLSISCNIEYNSVVKDVHFLQKILDIYLILGNIILYYENAINISLIELCFYIFVNLLYIDIDIVPLFFKCIYTIILPTKLVFLIDNKHFLFRFNFNNQLFTFIMICWFTDIACYISGKLFKNPHLLNEKLGKGKTVEGIIGGYILGTIFSVILQLLFLQDGKPELTWLLPMLSITGDIVESAIKRNLKIKDFGDVFPGHGGFLDRFDSVIFSCILLTINNF